MDINKPDVELMRSLAADKAGASHRLRSRLWLLLVVAIVVAAAALWLGRGGKATQSYKSEEARRGDLTVTVTATGTLQPVNKVDVGSELSGTIASVAVDYNDRVTQGQPLATLDTEILQARLAESRAALQSAQAKVQDAAATVTETRLNYKRCEDLVPRQMCSQSDLDKLRAAYQRGEAGVTMAKAQEAQARATLDSQETNLKKAVIRAPINGIVLDRKVEPGQTVAASFQTPVLFTLAEDLTHMELQVAIDEADIGQVRVGQPATFSVDAFPNRTYNARVVQIRQAPQTVDGVVTYQTVLSVDNDDQTLLPGMTATVEVVVNQLKDTLLIPNAALRFSPPVTATAPKSSGFSLFPHRPPSAPRKAQESAPVGSKAVQRVWTLRDGVPTPISVRVGATDGRSTQLLSGDVTAGMALLTDTVSAAK